MVQHIVLWTLKDGVDKEAVFAELETVFAAFAPEVPGMESLKLYRGFGGYDVCLISLHEDREALRLYQEFPAHVEAKALVARNRAERASVDFEL